MPTIEENTARYKKLLGSVHRDGIRKLMEYMESGTDFYTAPASTRFHLAREGGLLQHSLNVYDCLMDKRENPVWKDILNNIPIESLRIVSLLHDICKANFYKETTKNQKTYDRKKVMEAETWQRKHDSMGDYIWETVKTYQVDEQLPLGHGEKSVIVVQKYLRLTVNETMGIRWHMGFSEPKEAWNALGVAMDKYPIILAVYEADLEATKILESGI